MSFAFDFSEEDDRDGGAQNIQRLLSGGDDDDGVAVVGENVAHDVGGLGIGFDGEYNGLLFRLHGTACGVHARDGGIHFRCAAGC